MLTPLCLTALSVFRLHHMWQGVMDRFGTEVLRIESEAKKFLDESFRALRYVICKIIAHVDTITVYTVPEI